VLGAELVGGPVAFDAQGMEELAHRGVEPQGAVDAVEEVALAGTLIHLDAEAGGDVLGHGLAELAQLDQGGVGVMTEGALGAGGELEKYRVVAGQKGEVAAGILPGTAAIPAAWWSLHRWYPFPVSLSATPPFSRQGGSDISLACH
jgi:hypothetical protein